MALLEVTLPVFIAEAGTPHTAKILHLWDEPGNHALVLFTDPSGEEVALLPIGPGHPYRAVRDVQALEFEGLRAKCWVAGRAHARTPAAVQPPAPSAQAAPARMATEDATLLGMVKDALAGGDPKLRAGIVANLDTRLDRLRQREVELEVLAENLRQREQFVADCENKLTSIAQGYLERESSLEQREQELDAKERQFFRRVGEPEIPSTKRATR